MLRRPIVSPDGVNSLTSGFFETFVLGPDDQPQTTPTLQVLNWKQTQAGTGSTQSTRYRLILSDGKHSYKTCMAASQIGPRFDRGDMDEMAVFILKKYIMNHLGQEGRRQRVLVLIDFDVVSKPGERLGNPTPLSANPADFPQPLPTHNNIDEPPSEVVPVAQQQERGPPRIAEKAFPRLNHDHMPGSVHPINSLTPYQNKWRIRARVSCKGDIRTWSNARGEGKLFSLDLADQSGEIRATVWKDQVDKFNGMLQQGQVYFISGGTIKQANKQFTSIKNDYEISFTNQTEVIPCYDPQDDVPQIRYNFVKFNQLEKCVGTLIDIVGVLKSAGDVTPITTKKNETFDKRDLVMVDDTNTAVTLTLWRERAKNLDLKDDDHPVIAVKGVSVREFQGINLSPAGGSQMVLNPDIKESHVLKGWWISQGYLQEATMISQQRTAGAGGGFAQLKLIAAADAQGLGKNDQTADYFNINAQLILAKHDNCLYQSCETEGCKKKVVDLGNGNYRCEKCNKEMSIFRFNAMLSAEVADFTGTRWVTFFADQVTQLTGKTPDELGRLREANPDDFEKLFRELLFKPMMFRIRAKTEFFNDESRVKWTVQNVKPLDLAGYETFLTEQIDRLDKLNV